MQEMEDGRRRALTKKVTLSTYKDRINQFLPFVLIRCSKYTNNKRLAEIISIYAFICAYLLYRSLDGSNKIEIIIDNMVGVVGEDLGKTGDSPENGTFLFEDENVLSAAKILAEMNMKALLAKIRLRMDYLDCFFDRVQFGRINDSVMDYLKKYSHQHLPLK